MNVFEIFATLGLDKSEFDNGMDDAENKAKKGGSKIGSGLAKAAKTTMKATAVAIGAAVAGVSAVVKKSVQAYAEYEQLAGGVNKLFGDGSAEATYAVDVVMANARNAWKTAGMSMNEYMDTVTGFSASLISSLGGDQVQAAAYADMAVRSMSDNANTFGTDIASIQAAYSGFAKQNYTMLDNLKLGYGGTKEEMERLIADANEYAAANGMAANLSIDSFADIVQAIELIQQKQGIAGTTAKEAASTIQGSLGSAKAAWENLLVGIADPDQDFGSLVDNFVEAAGSAANNLLPRITVAINGVGKLIQTLMPKILSALPDMLNGFLPTLADSAVLLFEQIATMLPDLIETLADVIANILPQIIPKLVAALPKIISALISAAGSLLKGLVSALGNIDWGGLWEGLKASIANTSIGKWFIDAWDSVSTFFTDTLPTWASDAWETIKTGVTTAFVAVGTWFEEAWAAVSTFFTETVPDWAVSAWDTIKTGITTAFATIGTLFSIAWSAVSTFFTSTIPTWASRAWATIKSAISTVFSKIGTIFSNAWSAVKTFFSTTIVGWAKGAWTSIKAAVSTAFSKVGTIFSTAWSAVKTFFGTTIVGWAKGAWTTIKAAVSGAFAGIKTIFKTAWQGVSDFFTTDIPQWASDAWSSFETSITEGFANVGTWFSTAWQGVSDFFTTTIPSWADSAWTSIKNVFAGIANWFIDNVINPVIDGINAMLGWIGVDIGHVQRIKVEGEVEVEDNSVFNEDGTLNENNEYAMTILLDYKNSGVVPEGFSVTEDGKLVADPITQEVTIKYAFQQQLQPSLDHLMGNHAEGNGQTQGSHAAGLTYVPYDNYAAMLHKGERVLDANEASRYNSILNGAGGVTTTLSIGEYHVHDGSDVQTLVDMLTNEQMRNLRAIGVRA